MLALALKGVDFRSRRLDHGAGENRTPAYLALNPTGQVPTLVHGDPAMGGVVIRESIAILAWLDRAFPERPVFGRGASEAARAWQDVMVFESDLRPLSNTIAQGLLRGRTGEPEWMEALHAFRDRIAALSEHLDAAPFLGGTEPMAPDLWLYPTLGWIARGVEKADERAGQGTGQGTGGEAPSLVRHLLDDHPPLATWRDRFAALPGVDATYPPHWRGG